jgi:hypothetical protein
MMGGKRTSHRKRLAIILLEKDFIAMKTVKICVSQTEWKSRAKLATLPNLFLKVEHRSD